MEKYEYGYLFIVEESSGRRYAVTSTGAGGDAWRVDSDVIDALNRLGALGWVINEGRFVPLGSNDRAPDWMLKLVTSKVEPVPAQNRLGSYTTHFMRRSIA